MCSKQNDKIYLARVLSEYFQINTIISISAIAMAGIRNMILGRTDFSPQTRLLVLVLFLLLFIFSCGFLLADTISSNFVYNYDATGRLVSVDHGRDYRIVYTYDSAGNMLESKRYIKDVDGNGAIDLKDLSVVLKIMTGQKPEEVLHALDVNGDGKLGIEEGVYILKEVGEGESSGEK